MNHSMVKALKDRIKNNIYHKDRAIFLQKVVDIMNSTNIICDVSVTSTKTTLHFNIQQLERDIDIAPLKNAIQSNKLLLPFEFNFMGYGEFVDM